MRSCVLLFLSALLLTIAADSQISYGSQNIQGNATLRGSLVSGTGIRLANLVIELSSLSGGGVQRTAGSSSGEFEFSDIPRGEYRIRIFDFSGNLIGDQMVSVRGMEFVQIAVQGSKVQRPSSGTVTVSQLMHKVPAKAEKEAQSAQKSWKKGDLLSCIDHLRKAIQLDPEYLDARRDLALVYVRLDQPENVISAYEEVLKIDPRAADAYSLMGAAYARLEHWADAETAARRALRLDPANGRSRYVLGVSLAAQTKDDGEALQYLRQSYEAYPAARMVTAHILAHQGQKEEARTQLLTFLPLATPAQRNQVEDWLARLNK